MPPLLTEPFHVSQLPREVAVVFVHGFTGDVRGTWGNIPDLLHSSDDFSGWDLLGFGYQSRRRFDILNLWSADASLVEIATELATAVALLPYKQISIVAHSMGGLVVQRALVVDPKLRRRVSHVILFGTPSGGLVKATLVSWLKQQTRNMSASGEFVQSLRAEWTRLELHRNLRGFLAVAGEMDQFVPPASSLGPFPKELHRVIPGNHISMLDAESLQAPAVRVIVDALSENSTASGPRASARVAVEQGEFRQVIDQLWPIRTELDDTGAVTLGLALDACGRRQDAIQFLEGHSARGTDVLGVLAGRYKRRWLLERRRTDAQNAFDLYGQAYSRARNRQPLDHEQAAYHGVNLAFLELAYGGDIYEARNRAGQVLEHCAQWPGERGKLWRLASEGDALLILGRIEEAIGRHADASQLPMKPWQALSIQEQALRTADLCGCEPEQLEAIAGLYEGRVQWNRSASS
jgi:pimeloyl-ACP methyl ester carboxylesterase